MAKTTWTRGITSHLAQTALKDGQFLLDTEENTLSADVQVGNQLTRRLIKCEPNAMTEAFIRSLFSDDDILTFADLQSFPVTGDASKIYIAMDTGKAYVWNGSEYEEFDYGRFSPTEFGIGLGLCETATATSTKVATLDGYNLVKNSITVIEFVNDVSVGASLNIESKGAFPIYYRGYVIGNDVIKSGDKATFIFDGTKYHLIGIDRMVSYSVRSETLATGSTSVTFTELPTTGDYLIDIYTSKPGLNYTDIDDSVSGSLTLTYDAQASSVTVYLKITRF